MYIVGPVERLRPYFGREFAGVTIGYPATEAEGVKGRRGVHSHDFNRAQLDAIRAAIRMAGDEDAVQILFEFPPDWRYTDAEPALASVLLQAVFTPAGTTREGTLVAAVTVPWFEIIQILKRDPAVAFQIPPDRWEEIIAGAYQKAGFEEVTLTPRSGDFGRDVIAVKHGLGSVRIIDQVKAFAPHRLVEANDVRALLGVVHGDGASKGFLTTTSDFAPRLRDDPLLSPFIPSRLELVNGERLLRRLNELAAQGPGGISTGSDS